MEKPNGLTTIYFNPIATPVSQTPTLQHASKTLTTLGDIALTKHLSLLSQLKRDFPSHYLVVNNDHSILHGIKIKLMVGILSLL